MAKLATHFDVLIVGAGISGIGAACHMQRKSPGRSFAILEGRENIGGTWDLFRYPGIRSDSDMYTLGYSFKPWTEAKAIADGSAILKYLNETIDENNLRGKIQFQSKVKRASWSTDHARWTLEIARGDSTDVDIMTCSYLFMCSGYYNYDHGYLPDFDGMADYDGQIVHPQHWPQDLDYSGKNVLVIGSGATAVTLVPAMAKDAAHVTMLQRSPTYIVSRPGEDSIANWLRKWLPAGIAYKIARIKNVLLTMLMFKLARKKPKPFKARLIKMVREELGPGFDIEKDYTPSYDPWDQRICAVPDSDLFHVIKDGSASVITDHIDRFTKTGILLKSGKQLQADIIVPATGLSLQTLGGMQVIIDGEELALGKTLNYKGMTLSGVPNFAWTVGYTNASWTLKADLTADYVCRILNHMEKHQFKICIPQLDGENLSSEPLLDLKSGYITRALDDLPKQGIRPPWRNHQNYVTDLMHLKLGKVDDGVMKFSRT